ncbi:hypothetical protein APR41_11435 [Salegentibacter salinarum]|uniref:Uncharacterized protein n=1 Tax=Salegentibacter salinarum TaxID=447422 RepID=A0A2N0TMD1_9FLAO|nr:hypothetical protein APR41_11435 [Salegentibacter salinarum]
MLVGGSIKLSNQCIGYFIKLQQEFDFFFKLKFHKLILHFRNSDLYQIKKQVIGKLVHIKLLKLTNIFPSVLNYKVLEKEITNR